MLGQTWAIIKISYNPGTEQAVGGICGTVFFVNQKQFISAHHCFNNSVFPPNPGYSKVKVFLANESGRIIENISLEKSVPEYDLAIGRLNSKENIDVLPAGNDFKVGDSVYNIGFPVTESLVSMPLSFVNGNLVVESVTVKAFRQDGIIEAVPIVNISAIDIKTVGKQMIKLSYTSRTGFSGGPLILAGSSKVIGMMSLVVPCTTKTAPQESASQRVQGRPAPFAMAVRMEDISLFI